MRRDPRLYLDDILESLTKIEGFVKEMSFDKFKKDDRTVDAVIRNFEIIGQAVKQLPKDIQLTYPELEWKEMAGMRDKLIHAYFHVNLEVVWKTAKERAPRLLPAVHAVLDDLERTHG